MININIKKISWKIFLIFWNICAIIGFVLTSYFLYIVFDDKGYCLSEQHGVWDNNQKICRHDCIKWDEERGCLPKEQQKDNEKLHMH